MCCYGKKIKDRKSEIEMILVIAEKPELSKDIAHAILRNMKYSDGVMYDDTYTVISSFGHLFKLYAPQDYDEKLKHFRLDALPISFDNWKRKPDETKIKRIKQIQELMKQADCIINAGDPDDEGQLLIDEIIEYFGFSKPVYRVYVNDSIPENIRREFANLKDNRNCVNDGKAAYARQMADYCFGINETRLVTILNKDKLPYGKVLSVGRVQTPTLGLIVRRDEAIANHIKSKYYELSASYSAEYGILDFKLRHNKEIYGERIEDKSKLQNIEKALPQSCISQTTVKTLKSAPPLPYNHTKICGDMSKRFGYKLSEVNTILQTLRDTYKAITYNRTDCQYLKEEHYEQAPQVLSIVFKNIGKEYPCDTSIHSACFNDKNVSAHHGIIPQKKEIDISQMKENERNVYLAICERYIMQFLPPQECEESVSIIDLGQHGQLEYKAKKLINMGFKEYFSDGKNDDFSKLFLSAGEHTLNLESTAILERETTPPKPYNDQTLIDDMASVAKYVTDPEIKRILIEKDKDKKGEHGGIGTVATRVAVIETLFKRGYVERKGKSIVSTQLGKEFYRMLPDNIKSADITAKWWLLQEEVREGRADVNSIQRSVVEEFMKHKDTAYKTSSLSQQALSNGLVCPFCGKAMRKWDKGYSCTGHKNGCQFTIWSEVAGKKLTESQVKAICEKGKTGAIKGFMSKAGKEFTARLVLNRATRKLEFEFVKTKPKKG